MRTYTGRGTLAAALRIIHTEVLYVLGVWQWFSILQSHADASRAADLGYPKGALPAEEELVGTLLSEHLSEH
jgi:hypothetical protein